MAKNYDLPFQSDKEYMAWLELNTPPIVCLCGSTRFKTEFEDANRLFTLKGYVVLSVGHFIHADSHPITPDQKNLLDTLHKSKIHMSDMVYIVNPGNYIGESTRGEIEYASSLGIPIYYHDTDPIGV